MTVNPELRGLILDLDGTLIDSNDAHAQAWAQAFAQHGFDISAEEVRPLIGMGGDKLLPTLAGIEADSEQGKALVSAWGSAFRPLIRDLRATPGARELVAGLRGLGFEVILGSSGEDETVEAELRHIGLEELLSARVQSDEVERSKPDPDIVEIALHKLNLAPQQVMMVGDTHFDAEAAARAGVRCVLLRCGGNTDLPAQTYDDPQALLLAFLQGQV